MFLRTRSVILVVALVVCALISPAIEAHGVPSKDARFLESLDGPAVGPLMYLGAKHMVTGYDHLLFLVGVVFFLYDEKTVLLRDKKTVPATAVKVGSSVVIDALGDDESDLVAEVVRLVSAIPTSPPKQAPR